MANKMKTNSDQDNFYAFIHEFNNQNAICADFIIRVIYLKKFYNENHKR